MSERDRIKEQPSPQGGQGRTAPRLGGGEKIDPDVWSGASARTVSGAGASSRRAHQDLASRRTEEAPKLSPGGRAREQTRSIPAQSAPAAPPSEARPQSSGREAPPQRTQKRRAEASAPPRRRDQGGRPTWSERGAVGSTAGLAGWHDPSGRDQPRAPREKWRSPWEGEGWFASQLRGRVVPPRTQWKAPWDEGPTVFDGLGNPAAGGTFVTAGFELNPARGSEGHFTSLDRAGTSQFEGFSLTGLAGTGISQFEGFSLTGLAGTGTSQFEGFSLTGLAGTGTSQFEGFSLTGSATGAKTWWEKEPTEEPEDRTPAIFRRKATQQSPPVRGVPSRPLPQQPYPFLNPQDREAYVQAAGGEIATQQAQVIGGRGWTLVGQSAAMYGPDVVSHNEATAPALPPGREGTGSMPEEVVIEQRPSSGIFGKFTMPHIGAIVEEIRARRDRTASSDAQSGTARPLGLGSGEQVYPTRPVASQGPLAGAGVGRDESAWISTLTRVGMTSISWRDGDMQAAPDGVAGSTHLPSAAGALGGDGDPPEGLGSFSSDMHADGGGNIFFLKSQKKAPLLPLEEEESPERIPPSPWMGALGYAMQYTIVDAMLGTQIAADYISRNAVLQEFGAQLDSLHAVNPFEYPSLQDLIDIMGYTAKHITRYYDKQRRELGFDTMIPFHEVGLLHNYKAYNEARDRINALLKDGSLSPEEIALLTDPRAQVTEDRWKRVNDKRLRQDMQIVKQPSTLYIDTRNGQTTHYLAPDGVRPDIIRVLTNNGPQDDDMPYLVNALGYIIKGSNKRRNIQDFSRWVKDKVPYIGGEEITALEALDRFCQRLAAGEAHIIIDEVKTRSNKFSRYHTDIDFALGHIPEPGTGILDTDMGADISGTTHAVVELLRNALGYDSKTLFRMDPYWTNEFTEISFNMLNPDTLDTVHARAADIVIPVPRFRVYSVSLRELYHGWKKRENRIKDIGHIYRVRSERNGPVTILPYIP